eukprot:31359-Pelagococcus_subviridis.AAC.1
MIPCLASVAIASPIVSPRRRRTTADGGFASRSRRSDQPKRRRRAGSKSTVSSGTSVVTGTSERTDVGVGVGGAAGTASASRAPGRTSPIARWEWRDGIAGGVRARARWACVVASSAGSRTSSDLGRTDNRVVIPSPPTARQLLPQILQQRLRPSLEDRPPDHPQHVPLHLQRAQRHEPELRGQVRQVVIRQVQLVQLRAVPYKAMAGWS